MVKPNIAIFTLLFLSPFLSFSQEKNAEKQIGLLWEISDKNKANISYLYGTMHVSKKVAFNLSDTFFLGLKNVDKIALESDPSTWMEHFSELNDRNKEIQNLYYYRYNSPKNFYKTIFSCVAPVKDLYRNFLSTDNPQVNQILYRASGNDNFREDTYLDLFIYQAAKKWNKEVIALEENNKTLELLAKANTPPDEDEKNKKKKSYYKPRRNTRTTLEDAYRSGNLTLIDSLNKEATNNENYYKYFITERNIIMANRMDSFMQKGTTLFTGIGAAHLPGEFGVINLLKEKGYTVRPVTKTTSKKSEKLKNKLESSFVHQKLKKQYSLDSTFQIDLPGQLYKTYNYYGHEEYLFPDVSNGAFYSIARIKTYGILHNQSPEDIRLSIDSLLFENIPGDIEKKELKTIGKHPAISIVNKTVNGSYQRYLIIITPLEAIIIKGAGQGKFILGPEINKIFSSITVDYNQTASFVSNKWQIETYPNRWFNRTDFEYRQSKTAQLQAYSNEQYQLFVEGVLHDYDYIEEDSFELSYLAKELAEELDAKLCDYEYTLHQGYPALVGLAKKDSCMQDFLKLKLIIKGTHFYLMINNDLEKAADFFASLKFTNPKYPKWETTQDTVLLFSVKTYPQPVLKAHEAIRLQNFNRSRKENRIDSKNTEKVFHNKVFEYKKTNEKIYVQARTFDKYDSATEEELWIDRKFILMDEDDNLYVHKEEKKRTKEGMYINDIILADSTSSRAIKVRMLLQNGILYTLKTNIDTSLKTTEFVDVFYDSFSPKDTVIRMSYFSPKGMLLLDDLRSTDSLTKAEAKDYCMDNGIVSFGEEDKDSLIHFIHNYPFEKADISIKAFLIEELGDIPSPSITEDLVKLYSDAAGTTSIELACLNALSERESKEDIAALLKLAQTGDLPLPFYDRDVNDLFRNLDDSLALIPPLFPAFYQYLSYPEYKDKIFGLLADMIENKTTTSEIYGLQKKRIIREAINSIKRQLAGEEEEEELFFNRDYNSFSTYNRTSSYAYDIEEWYDSFLGSQKFINSSYRGASTKSKLLMFTKLMLPLYQDPLAKPFFEKVVTTKDGELLFKISKLFLENEIPVPDSIWTNFSKKAASRIPTYILLKDKKEAKLLDTTFLNQQDFAKALLDLELDPEKKDSIQFVCKKEVQINQAEGHLYFFKFKKETNDYWTLYYTGLFSKDSTDLLPIKEQDIYYRKNLIIKKEKTVDELIEEQIEALQLQHRKRISEQYSYGDYDY